MARRSAPRQRPATPEALAFDLDCTVSRRAGRSASALGLVEVDDTGGVVGAHGLNRVPTRHTLTTKEAELHTWCVDRSASPLPPADAQQPASGHFA